MLWQMNRWPWPAVSTFDENRTCSQAQFCSKIGMKFCEGGCYRTEEDGNPGRSLYSAAGGPTSETKDERTLDVGDIP
jgi:hypothetical protein